jgi:hypothetical protein
VWDLKNERVFMYLLMCTGRRRQCDSVSVLWYEARCRCVASFTG